MRDSEIQHEVDRTFEQMTDGDFLHSEVQRVLREDEEAIREWMSIRLGYLSSTATVPCEIKLGKLDKCDEKKENQCGLQMVQFTIVNGEEEVKFGPELEPPKIGIVASGMLKGNVSKRIFALDFDKGVTKLDTGLHVKNRPSIKVSPYRSAAAQPKQYIKYTVDSLSNAGLYVQAQTKGRQVQMPKFINPYSSCASVDHRHDMTTVLETNSDIGISARSIIEGVFLFSCLDS